MTTRKKVWISVTVFVLMTVIAILYSLGQIMYRLERVNDGLANPDFPYKDYTVEELGKLYPQERNNDDVPTTRTPEETHKLFMDYLKKEDFKNASKCCFLKGDQNYMEETFNIIESEKRMEIFISELENIEENSRYESFATYDYMTSYKDYKFKSGINFKKNREGVWLMERF